MPRGDDATPRRSRAIQLHVARICRLTASGKASGRSHGFCVQHCATGVFVSFLCSGGFSDEWKIWALRRRAGSRRVRALRERNRSPGDATAVAVAAARLAPRALPRPTPRRSRRRRPPMRRSQVPRRWRSRPTLRCRARQALPVRSTRSTDYVPGARLVARDARLARRAGAIRRAVCVRMRPAARSRSCFRSFVFYAACASRDCRTKAMPTCPIRAQNSERHRGLECESGHCRLVHWRVSHARCCQRLCRTASRGVRKSPRGRNGQPDRALRRRPIGQPLDARSARSTRIARPSTLPIACMTGQIDIIIFMTGVGIRHLIAEVERHVDRQRLLAAISDITTIARGPKPVAVLKELGLQPTLSRARAQHLARGAGDDRSSTCNVAQQTVGLQEYGQPNASLVAGLEARGARVAARARSIAGTCRSTRRRWKRTCGRSPPAQIDVAMFTSSHQVVNLLRVAERLQLAAQLRRRHVAGDGRLDRPDHQRNAARVRVSRRRRAGALEDGATGGRRRRAGPRSWRDASGDRDRRSPQRRRPPPPRPRRAPGPWDDGPFMRACRRAAGRAHADLADAAGRPLHGRVSRGAREDHVSRAVQEPGAVRRGDDHGRRAAGRRRGDHLFRPAADPRADGPGAGVRRRRRAGDSQSAARRPPTSSDFASWNRSSRWTS